MPRLTRPRPRRADVINAVVAVILLAWGFGEIWVPFESRNYSGSPVLTSISVVLLCLPVAVRRRWPLGVMGFQLIVFVLLHLVGPLYLLAYGQFVPVNVAMYQAVRHGSRRAPAIAGALMAVMVGYIFVLYPPMRSLNEAAFEYGVVTLVWLAAFGLRVQARRVQVNLQRAIDVEVAAAEQTLTAVIDERTRIARELHDIVAHSVSVMVVQAGAAEQVVDDDPAYARRALETIRGTGTAALTEMRRVVSVLRDPDAPGSLEPQPGVASLPDLITHTRENGLDVDFAVRGDPRALSDGLDLTVFRIVQEALSNVRRHAHASQVRIRLDYTADAVAVEVADDGIGADLAAPVGHGLAGMRERAALYGGRVETESGDGFVVRVQIPVAVG